MRMVGCGRKGERRMNELKKNQVLFSCKRSRDDRIGQEVMCFGEGGE